MPIHRKEFTKLLPIDLTDEEIREAAENMASAVIQLRELEKEKKAAAAGFKEAMDIERRHISRNAELIEKGHREEEIACEQIFDYEEKGMKIIRLDTKEIVEEREMSEEELQMQFPDEGEKTDPV